MEPKILLPGLLFGRVGASRGKHAQKSRILGLKILLPGLLLGGFGYQGANISIKVEFWISKFYFLAYFVGGLGDQGANLFPLAPSSLYEKIGSRLTCKPSWLFGGKGLGIRVQSYPEK